MSASSTRDFAETLLGLAAAGFEPAAEAAARDLLRDGLAVGALGAREAAPQLIASLAREAGGKPDATLFAQSALTRVPAVAAARVNGAAMHVLDFEPMWNPANHSLSTTLPAVLALAEARGIGAVLPALALGIEAQARMRIASGQFEPGQLLFHPPGMVGAIGSAAACALMLGLDATGMAHEIGRAHV